MPTKVTPLPKVSSTAGGVGGGGAGAGAPKAGAKPGAKGATAKPKLFDQATSRLSAAKRDFKALAERGGSGTMSSILFVAFVGLGLTALGIFLVIYGDQKYIIDLMVLGGLCLVMGVGSFVMGLIFVMWPVYKQRKLQREKERSERASMPPGGGQQDNYAIPAAYVTAAGGDSSSRTVGDASLRPAPSTSSLHPDETDLYEMEESVGVVPDSRGKLALPPPPLLAQPRLDGRPGTTSSSLSVKDPNEISDADSESSGSVAGRRVL